MQLNTKQVDGLLLAIKAYDEAVASSTTLQDDDELQFPMLANEIWEFEFFFFWDNASATPDLSFSLNGPGTPLKLQAHLVASDSAAVFNTTASDGTIITAYGTRLDINPSNPPVAVGWARGVVWNGSTAGNLVLQWCQRSSLATATFVRAGSYVWARLV